MARITKREAAEIARLRRNAQAKVRRLAARGVTNLPTIIPINGSMSRQKVNQAKDFLRSFTNRANQSWQFVKQGEIYTTKKQANAIKREQKRVNSLIAKRSKRYDNLPYRIGGELTPSIDRRVAEYRNEGMPRFYSKEYFKSQGELTRYLERLRNFDPNWLEAADETWRENTIKAIEDQFSPEERKELVERIKNLSIEEFTLAMSTQDISIAYIYTDADMEGELERLLDYFDRELFMQGL